MKTIAILLLAGLAGCSRGKTQDDPFASYSIGSHLTDTNAYIVLIDTNKTPPQSIFLRVGDETKAIPGFPDITNLTPGTVYYITKDGEVQQDL